MRGDSRKSDPKNPHESAKMHVLLGTGLPGPSPGVKIGSSVIGEHLVTRPPTDVGLAQPSNVEPSCGLTTWKIKGGAQV